MLSQSHGFGGKGYHLSLGSGKTAGWILSQPHDRTEDKATIGSKYNKHRQPKIIIKLNFWGVGGDLKC